MTEESESAVVGTVCPPGAFDLSKFSLERRARFLICLSDASFKCLLENLGAIAHRRGPPDFGEALEAVAAGFVKYFNGMPIWVDLRGSYCFAEGFDALTYEGCFARVYHTTFKCN
jgi:hypothetical protein